MYITRMVTDDFEIIIKTKTQVLRVPLLKGISETLKECGVIAKELHCFKEPELFKEVSDEL